MALGQFLYSLLRSGEAYPRPTMKMIWGSSGGGRAVSRAPLTLPLRRRPGLPRASGWALGTHLVAVVDVGVRELPRHELIQHDAVGVDVGLEAERVIILHPDHLWGLRNQVHLLLGAPAVQEAGWLSRG